MDERRVELLTTAGLFGFGDRVMDLGGAVRKVSYQLGTVLWFLDGGTADARDVWRLDEQRAA